VWSGKWSKRYRNHYNKKRFYYVNCSKDISSNALPLGAVSSVSTAEGTTVLLDTSPPPPSPPPVISPNTELLLREPPPCTRIVRETCLLL
jgi:hypothetical protein